MSSATISVAANDTVDDLASVSALYWLFILSISFVQGALNGLFTLLLKSQLFDHAGYKWTEAFWSGFPIACLVTILGDDFLGLSGRHDSQIILNNLTLSISFAFFLITNFLLMYVVAKRASRE